MLISNSNIRHKQSKTEIPSVQKNSTYNTNRCSNSGNNPINIVENEFSNKGTTIHSPESARRSLDRTKSSKVAQQIDNVHKEHQRRKSSKVDETYPSINVARDSSNTLEEAPQPSKTFTNTILQYKEQIRNMRSYLKDLE